ncbi:SpoIIAA-like anti-anti-sigma regulatory factor [Orenia metallireducens]|jgi:stage II sporulation protein AA (anti-sigma F factor antagonist)|uniref:Anti-sigma factor antagonist n=1 Tax=Orenia metallireducens TaxID=1413210 RepID=A0A285HKX8_9FIRM|nr:anti-sigma factor antagonist [Orenia metallireducens]PRX26711.1 SpoIIAA-like anti-anti-sigma regulatory factor [Orenia metallireducens]SNY36314.1 anti-anti-sigma regulatory factor, SpoIIAA [Orenia metallireducens]
MKLSFKKYNNKLVVRPYGEFDLHTVDIFKEKLEQRLTEDINGIILNLDGIKFIDSSGLGAIIGTYKRISNKGGVLAIAEVTPQVERIFEISGILKIIKLYPSEAEALDNIVGR